MATINQGGCRVGAPRCSEQPATWMAQPQMAGLRFHPTLPHLREAQRRGAGDAVQAAQHGGDQRAGAAVAAPAADRRGRGRGREGGRTEWMTSTNTCSSNPWPLSQKGEATGPRLLSSLQPPRAPRDPAPAPPGDWDPAHQWTYMRSPRRMRAQQSSARRDMAASLVTLPSRMGRCRKSSLSCGGLGEGRGGKPALARALGRR